MRYGAGLMPIAPAALPLPPATRVRRLVVAWGLALASSACIVVPRTAEVYDPACQAYVKQIVLEAEVIGHIGRCSNDGCAVMLASMGIVSAASAVVAGSVAVVGNIVYWMERRGQCPAEVASPASAAASR